ncbi:MAG: hypothetical protein IH991_23575, partial [Planctomycetes bacterium]|nr:hypothetical protein [Planctomycetota bacterium]
FLVPDSLVEGKKDAKDNNKVNKKPPKTISKNRSLPSNQQEDNAPKTSLSDALSPEIKDQTQKRNELTSNQSSTNNTDIGRTHLRDNSSKENLPPDKTSTDGNLNPKNEDFVGIRDAPVYTPKQLSNAVAKARNTMDAWQGADSENSATLGKEFYIALATVGHMVSCVDQGDSRFRDSLNTTHQLLGQLARSSLTVSRLAEQAGVWLKQADRANDGIVLAGRVASQIRQGKLVESRIELLSDPDTVVPFVTARDPSSVFRPGSRILVISAIVDDPQENLGGYTGTASRVIYGGWVQVIRN